MKTHTIRNKQKPTPIVTLTPDFFTVVKEAMPEAFTLMLGLLVKQLQTLTGKKAVLAHEQHVALMAVCGADETGGWPSRFNRLPALQQHVMATFERGFLVAPTMPPDEALALAQAFYTMLARELPPEHQE